MRPGHRGQGASPTIIAPTPRRASCCKKTQWCTVGFPVIIASTVVLGYYAHTLIRLWFESQTEIVAANLVPAYMVASLVGFIVIPALCWVQVTPERWIREVEQAHNVRKLELMQRGELALVRARLLWAEQQEVRDTLRGLLMGIADSQRSIACTMGLQGEIERSIMGGQEIADSLDYVSQQLEKPAQSMDRAITWIDGQDRGNSTTLENLHISPHVDSRLQSSMSRGAEPDLVRHSRTESDDAAHVLDTIRDVLPRVFTAQDVAELMRWKDKRPAQRVIKVWIDDRHAEEVRLGRYGLT